MGESSRAGTLRSATSVLLCLVAVTACSSMPQAEERPPDAFGWVIGWEQSPDFRYDPVAGAVIAGSVTLTLEDGTSVAVVTSTDLSERTCAAFGSPDEDPPCWVHAGLGPGGATADWLTVFGVEEWVPAAPGAVPVADRVYSSRALVAEHDDRLVLRDGTVLPFDRDRAEVTVLGVPDPSLDDALDRLAPQGLCDIVVDQQTGAVALLDCRLPY